MPSASLRAQSPGRDPPATQDRAERPPAQGPAPLRCSQASHRHLSPQSLHKPPGTSMAQAHSLAT